MAQVSFDRVLYFKPPDLLYGTNLEKIETIIIPELQSVSINDAIEFYNINKYFKEGARRKTWSEDQNNQYNEKSKKLFELTCRFFSLLDNTNIIDQYSFVDDDYIRDFWILFDFFKLYKKISPDIFSCLILSDNISPEDLFSHREIVNKYGTVLRKYILDNLFCIRILLYVYEQDYNDNEKLYLPDELTGNDICCFIEKYINNEEVNANVLASIENMRNTSKFPITDEIRLAASRRYKKEIEKMSSEETSFIQEIQVIFSNEQEIEKSVSYDGHKYLTSYSTRWLEFTLDFPSVLNNFIYIFEYVDFPQMRCKQVFKESESGVFERAFASKSRRVYQTNAAFSLKNGLASMQMNAYYYFLQKNGIAYESVLKWFFTEYLQTEFDCPEVRVDFPSINSTYSEKCVSICSAMESILKQFTLYVKHKEIDFDLLQMSSGSLKFGDIPSLMVNKYIYGYGKDFDYFKFVLFSDQCTFNHIMRVNDTKHEYKCFFDLISKEDVYLSDYRVEEERAFRYLEENDILCIDKNGRIKPGNIVKLSILKDLNDYEVISRYHYPPYSQEIIQEWIEKGYLFEKSRLLSEPEVRYLDYLLNQSEFVNGLEIRNKYSHGISQTITDDNEHKQNYLTLLRVMTLIAIKINDDFCLFDEANETE